MTKERYQIYLLSEHWKKTRMKRMKIDHFHCIICKKKRHLNVHHLSYKNIGKESVLNDLITICQDCHSKEHQLPTVTREFSKKKKHHNKRKWRLHKVKGICSIPLITKKESLVEYLPSI